MNEARSRTSIELLLVWDALFCKPVRLLKKNSRFIAEGVFFIFFITFLSSVLMIPGIMFVMFACAAGKFISPLIMYTHAHLAGALFIFGSAAAVLFGAYAWVHWFIFPRAVANALAYELGDNEAQPLSEVIRKKKGKGLKHWWKNDAGRFTKTLCYYMIPLYAVLGMVAFITMGLGIVNQVERFLDYAAS